MSECEKFINKIAETLPNPCSVKDLVRVGIFKSSPNARNFRSANKGPPYIQLTKWGRVIYPKEGVIKWLQRNVHETEESSSEIL